MQNTASENELASKIQEKISLEKKLNESIATRDLILLEIEANFQDDRRKREDDIRKLEGELKLKHALAQELHTQELAQLNQTLVQARSKNDQEIGQLMNQTERLRQYVKAKADPLLKLDFITQEQYDDILGKRAKVDENTSDWPIFDDTDGNYAGLVSHIQSYLYHQKQIVYPRALLENFLALLRTGDLIILSGLSGSGKTTACQIVRKSDWQCRPYHSSQAQLD